MYINMLFQYKEHLSELVTEIDTLAKEIEEYMIIQSIPGIGEKIAATIISEIGEIDRFNHPKKLVAFAGVDQAGCGTPYIWLFALGFVIVVNRKQLMKLSQETRD
jgi:Holliday junction resolvasome RuvABC DNA-binding subunit